MAVVFIAVHQADRHGLNIIFYWLDAVFKMLFVQIFDDFSISIYPFPSLDNLRIERVRFLNIQREKIGTLLVFNLQQVTKPFCDDKQCLSTFSLEKSIRAFCCRQPKFERRKKIIGCRTCNHPGSKNRSFLTAFNLKRMRLLSRQINLTIQDYL